MLQLYLKRAVRELEVESKTLLPEVEAYLSTLDWPGNVRQLENTCHWLAVMTSGPLIHMSDLPDDLQPGSARQSESRSHSWSDGLLQSVDQKIAAGHTEIADEVIPQVEKILIAAALKKTAGRRNDAAKLLGWGRNTLTRKIKEYELKA